MEPGCGAWPRHHAPAAPARSLKFKCRGKNPGGYQGNAAFACSASEKVRLDAAGAPLHRGSLHPAVPAGLGSLIGNPTDFNGNN